jgi:hypothetical protein
MFTARARKHLINNTNLNFLAQASLPSASAFRRFIMSTSAPTTFDTTSITSATSTTPAAQTRTDVPINLVSVNTAPERAKRLIGILIEDVKDRYNIRHAGNSDSESRVGSGVVSRMILEKGRI